MKKSLTLISLTLMLTMTGMVASQPTVEAQRKPRPSNDVALIVTIAGSANMPNGYRIVSDSGTDYVDGEQGVSAKFQVDNGSNDFVLDPTSTAVAMPRALYFDFTDQIASGTIANPWSGADPQTGSTMRKIDTFVIFNAVNTLAVGATMKTGAGFGQLFVGTGKQKTNYRVAFNPDGLNAAVINTPNRAAEVVVTRIDCDTWEITPDSVSYGTSGLSGPVAALINLDTVKSAGQYLMDFKMTLKRKTPTVGTCPQ